ncbi:MAG: histidinol-phosphate transaminase [Fusobacteriaceae bacterium]
MEKILGLFRENILKLNSYNTTLPETNNEKNFPKIFLNANENPYLPYPENKNCHDVNRYPDSDPNELIKILKKIYELNDGQEILVTRGSDEVIDILVRSFCEPKKDEILIFPPTFGMYEIYSNIQDSKVLKISLDAQNNFELDMKNIFAYLEKNSPKIIFITNPSAPLGHNMNAKNILELAEKLRDKSIIVVDEAYIEFSTAKSFADQITKFPNIIVMRTLSKAFAMAGLRLGVAIGHPKIIQILKGVRAPYALSIQSIKTATEALSPEGILFAQEKIQQIISEREKLISEFKKFSFITKIFPTATNFIFIQVENSEKFLAKCLERNIFLRSQASAIKNGVRISVGTESENKILLEVMKSFQA